MAPRDLFVAQVGVEVVGDAIPEPVEVGVYEKGIAAGLDARKRGREQFGQRGPVKPVLTNRRLRKGQAQMQYRLEAVV